MRQNDLDDPRIARLAGTDAIAAIDTNSIDHIAVGANGGGTGRVYSFHIEAPDLAGPSLLFGLEVVTDIKSLSNGDWVAEGRDIATVVAPDAEVKVYLTADAAERARRREIGVDELHERDQRDQGHGRSTLDPAPGAVVVDTTGLTLDEVVDRVAELAK